MLDWNIQQKFTSNSTLWMGKQCHQKDLYYKSFSGKPFDMGEIVSLHFSAVPRGTSTKFHCYWQDPYKVHADAQIESLRRVTTKLETYTVS